MGLPTNIDASYSDSSASAAAHQQHHDIIHATVNNTPKAANIVDQYGAVGDDSTDNSTAIQNALNAGGPIYIPPGTFRASSLNIASDNTYIFGAGMTSVLKLKNSANTNLFTVSATANRFFVTFFNFKIDGNKANNSSGAAIYAHYAHTWLFDRLHIANAAAEGIRFEGNGSFFALNNRVRACRIEDTRNQGINLQGFAPNNHIENNIVGGTDNFYGIEDTNSENRILGNHIHGTAGHGIYANNSTNGHYVDNYVESSNGSGIYAESSSVGARIEANTCFNNGLISAGDGITVAGTDATVIGNRCYDRQVTKTQDYGIQLKSGSTRVLVIGNHARSSENQTGGILDSGTANTLSSNQTT